MVSDDFIAPLYSFVVVAILMSNLIACMVFNVVGLGMSYFLFGRSSPPVSSPRKRGFSKQNKSWIPAFAGMTSEDKATPRPNWGSCVFWGSWGSLLLTYGLWLLMPDKLNIACYLTFAIALVGCGLWVKEHDLTSFLRSEYFVSFLAILPFLFIVSYLPRHSDELSHWVSLPKVFYDQNSLIPVESWHTGNYTPLWTLQATFFQFFVPNGFDASLIYAVRLNLMVAFFFFIKEKCELDFLKAFIFVLGGLIIFFVTKSAQNLLIEQPLCLLLASLLFLIGERENNQSKQNMTLFIIAVVCLYMLKKPLIAVVPAVCYILWVKGYKKHLVAFLVLFAGMFLSWKFKTAHMNEPWQYHFKVEGLWNDSAMAVYKHLKDKAIQDTLRSLLFLGSLGIIYKRSKDAFVFYTLFAGVYFLGLIVTYVYAFEGYAEAAINASYVRYVKIVFAPAYVYALYSVLATSSRLTQWEEALLKKRTLPPYTFSVVVVLLFACFFYPSMYKILS